MIEDPVSIEESGALSVGASDHILLLDTAIGLMLPGLVLILAPDILLVGENPIATAAILISELFILSVHLGLQDSPSYDRLAPLLLGPLALAPAFAIWLALKLPLIVGIITLLPAMVFARSAYRAWQHLR